MTGSHDGPILEYFVGKCCNKEKHHQRIVLLQVADESFLSRSALWFGLVHSVGAEGWAYVYRFTYVQYHQSYTYVSVGHLLFKDWGQSPPQLPFLRCIQRFSEGKCFQKKEQKRWTAKPQTQEEFSPITIKKHAVFACVFGRAGHKLSPTVWTWVIAESGSFWCLLAFAHATMSQNKGRGARQRGPTCVTWWLRSHPSVGLRS